MKKLLSLLDSIAKTSLTDVPKSWEIPYIVVALVSERPINGGSSFLHERISIVQINLIADSEDMDTLNKMIKMMNENKLDSSFFVTASEGVSDYMFEVEIGR